MDLNDRLEEISRNGLGNAHTIDFSKEYENSKQILEKGVNCKEWSEEDEMNCNRIIRFLEPHKTFFPTKETKEEMQNWIKNRLKSLRPSWKPTEEQMNCLCAAIDAAIRKHNESVSGYKPARVLKSLYEDLQKLM